MTGAAAPEAILIAGPTASGKSDWALQLAERVPAICSVTTRRNSLMPASSNER